MRRALAGPCLLFEDFGDPWLAREVAGVDRGADWTVCHGSVCVSRYAVGSDGRAARETFVESAVWRAMAGHGTAQPSVHWLAERELPWPGVPDTLDPAGAVGGTVVVYTVDVERLLADAERRRGVPLRSALPPGLCWPVIGHPGRLLLLRQVGEIPAVLDELDRVWGPAAEPPTLHRLDGRPTRG